MCNLNMEFDKWIKGIKSVDDLSCLMMRCPQTKDQNTLQHGYSVHDYFLDLKNHIEEGSDLRFEWKLPDWIYNESLWEKLADYKTIRNYHIYHDCGKPFCRTIDEDGKHHFPDHAMWSYKTWWVLTGNHDEGLLMARDMEIHLMKSGQEQYFAEYDNAATLLITGLCEMHSNASMFGGIDSTSFKIKWKNINRFGKRIAKMITS